MLNFIKNFTNDEDGAVTVDWVVLTAAIVALGLVVGNAVNTAATTKAGAIVGDINESAAPLTVTAN